MVEITKAPPVEITEIIEEIEEPPEMNCHLYPPNQFGEYVAHCGLRASQDVHVQYHRNTGTPPGREWHGETACPDCGATVCPTCFENVTPA